MTNPILIYSSLLINILALVHTGEQENKGEYFGPYPQWLCVRESLHAMQKIFPIRQCEDSFTLTVHDLVCLSTETMQWSLCSRVDH